MSKLFELRKKLNKTGISTNISNPDCWISTGNYALNFIMSGRFDVGIPNRRSVLFWGQSGTGKSFLLSNIAKSAQDAGYSIIYIDTEEAIHEDYLAKIGVDLSEEKFMPIRVYSIEETTKVMSEIFASISDTDKVCVICDSLSMLETEKEMEDFEKGEMKADQGLFAKRLKLLMKNINSKIGNKDMFFVASAHAYQNQDIRNGEGAWILSGGKGFQYIPSISVLLNKSKLRDTSEKTKVSGVVIKAEVTKTRFTQPFQKTELNVPYDVGIDPIDGLLTLAEEAGLVSKNGAWYSYEKDGETVKFQSSKFVDHYMNLFDFDDKPEIVENLEVEELVD